MQLELPFLRTEPSAPPIDFVCVRRARRYILRVGPDGRLRVTVPRGGSRAEAQRFAEKHLHWAIEERLRIEARQGPRRWTDGSVISVRGEAVTLRVSRRDGHSVVSYGDRQVRIAGDAGDLRSAIEADLRGLAREVLVPRLLEIAAAHRLTVTRVSIRSQQSRWGSCSRSGRIALNFRLVRMPPVICDYVLIHELMHLKQQNHGVRFWRLVEAACPEFRDAERWLRTEGRALF